MTFEAKKLASRIINRLEAVVREHALPGLAVAARRDGREVFAKGFGTRDAVGRLPVTADTRFGVASVTKFLTAVLMMRARDRDLIDLSDPVSRYYPDLHCARDGQMRLYHLLSHSAGFPGLPFRHQATPDAHTEGPDRMRTPGDLVAGMNALDIELLGSPGDRVSYSNESFCLLGGLVAALYRCSYAEAAERFVFQPLQMTRSVIGARITEDEADLATPLRRSGPRPEACGFWDAPLFYPAGGLIASARDMTRLISVLEGDTDVLSPQAASDMVSRSLPVASRPGFEARYGLGLEVTALDDGHILAWHTGQRPGISSFVGHAVQKNVSVAVATNIADAPSAAIGHEVIAEILCGEVAPGAGTWPPAADEVEIAAPDRFCGRYGSPEMGAFEVRRESNRLLVELPSGRQPLRFDSPRSGTVGGQTFCFLAGDTPASANQNATAFALELRILPRLGAT